MGLQTVIETAEADPKVVYGWNNTDANRFVIRVYAYDTAYHEGCSSYAGNTPLDERTEFGLMEGEQSRQYVSKAFATFVTPPSSVRWLVCFKHSLDPTKFRANGMSGKWQLAMRSDSSWSFTGAASQLWYHLPDATVGQYAVVQLLSTQSPFNFTYAPSGCRTDYAKCLASDNLKIVAKGTPCTYEYQSTTKTYIGSNLVDVQGKWDAGAAIDGLREGSTAGGLGAFGTRQSNPLVDSWSSTGDYGNFATSAGYISHAYVYLRLPQQAASFDICYSSRMERAVLQTENSSIIEAIPVWRKLHRCTLTSACASNDANKYFTTVEEPVGWSVAEFTPDTWGDIIFDDSNEMQLSSKASSPGLDYWVTAGGDYFKIVANTSFGEEVSTGRDTAAYGSFATTGCWSRDLDVPASTYVQGGFSEDGVLMNIGSRDLRGDISAVNKTASEGALGVVSSPLYIPTSGVWNVCYRRTCNFATATCNKYSGLRVLPFHSGLIGKMPERWMTLNATYEFALGQGHVNVLVPGSYGDAAMYPRDAQWDMPDRRAGTWGPLVVLDLNTTSVGTSMLDSRPWNFRRNYSITAGDNVFKTQGSRVRLVRKERPCSFPDWSYEASTGSQNKNGGSLECESLDAETNTTNCMGSAADVASNTQVAFYLTVPEIADYSVCFKTRGHHWRKISSTDGHSYYTPTQSPLNTLSFDATEDRALREALIIVKDTESQITVGPRLACQGCAAAGDMIRVVHVNKSCDMNPNGRNWYRDLEMSMICHVTGSGTTAQSGLFYNSTSPSVCSTHNNTKLFCDGTCNSTNPYLTELAKKTPDLYDDIVPWGNVASKVATAAAMLPLPTYDARNLTFSNIYKVCYKQAISRNWIVFNSSWEILPNDMKLLYPSVSNDLLAGEFQRFSVELLENSTFPLNETTLSPEFTLYTKLVKVSSKRAVQQCHNPPGSTEGEVLASATSSHIVDTTTNTTLDFYLTVPHTIGYYALCVQIRNDTLMDPDPMSWWGPAASTGGAVFNVIDNGVRWYVESGSEPTNQGLATIKMVKCVPTTTGCDTAASQDTFDTDAGADAAKIVLTSTACHGVSDTTFPWGTSSHIGFEGGGTLGVTDLGPANGPSDTGVIKTTLPGVASDAAIHYKFCVLTTPKFANLAGTAGVKRWMEVREMQGLSTQSFIVNPLGRAGFYTIPAKIATWSLDTGMNPTNTLYTSVGSTFTGMTGASTQIVSNVAAATSGTVTVGNGFVFNTFSDVTGDVGVTNEFKLVAAKLPPTRIPGGPATEATWGDVTTWADTGADCYSTAVDSASNLDTCTSYSGTGAPLCGSLALTTTTTQIAAMFHIPITPGAYMVCYRVKTVNTTAPWLWLPSATVNGVSSLYLYSHPAFLEMSTPLLGSNATAYDVRTMLAGDGTGTLVPISSWCGGSVSMGVDCAVQNAGFQYDLMTMVNETQICPAPTDTGGGTGATWYQMYRTTNASSVVTNGANTFTLPPYPQNAAGRYKICLFKAGEASSTQMLNASTKANSRSGIVYQLYNRGTTRSGGGTGFYRDTGGMGDPTKLNVVSSHSFNSSLRFMEYNVNTSTTYGSLTTADVTDATSGMVSRTPIVTSGSSVPFTVMLATDTVAYVPIGSYRLDILRCGTGTWATGLDCPTLDEQDPSVSPGTFTVWNVGGTCSPKKAAQYGWETNGLRQFTDSGLVALSIQYRSACPSGEFGCGVKFAVHGSPIGSPLYSNPYWVNVQSRNPNSVAVDGQSVDPAIGAATSCVSTFATTCYLKQCEHGVPCMLSFQARYNGPSEFAPLGTLTLGYSIVDYGSTVIPTAVTDTLGSSVSLGMDWLFEKKSWAMGGTYTHKFTPFLSGSNTKATFYLNATYGAGGPADWTRIAVEVVRKIPTSANIVAIMPKDTTEGLAKQSVPLPAVLLMSNVVKFGSYIEAMLPYRLEYQPMAGTSVVPSMRGAVSGWTIAGSITESTVSSVLKYNGPANTYITQPEFLASEVFQANLVDGTTTFAFDFRVYVADNACSRFNTLGGCTLKFAWTHATHGSFDMSFVTAVRVPASTLRITTSTVSATVSAGIQITAHPGSYIARSDATDMFVFDEFHYGDVFAMINGPYPTNGITNRDKVRTVADTASMVKGACAFTNQTTGVCALEKYPLKDLSMAPRWGASWKLSTTLPCNLCEFTFHSTWGAGPVSYELNADGTQPGVKTLTLEEDVVTLQCQMASSTVVFAAANTASELFDVVVTAVTGGSSAMYPRWRVWIDSNSSADVSRVTSSIQILKQTGVSTQILSQRMGVGATTTFTGLYFEGAAPAVPEAVTLSFHTAALVYSSGATFPAGSIPTGVQTVSCKRSLSIEQPTTVPSTTSISLSSVSGALAACPATQAANIPCYDYTTTSADLAGAPVSITVRFDTLTLGIKQVDKTVRNVTIVPKGGPSSTAASALVWTGTSASFTSPIVLDSAYNPTTPLVNAGNTYTFGVLNGAVERTINDAANNAVVHSGLGSILIGYDSTTTDKGTVRKAMFQVCDSLWTAGAEATGTMCLDFNLWVLPTTSTQGVALLSESYSGELLRGVAATCGTATKLTTEIVAYYTLTTVTTANIRFYAYETPLQYKISTTGTQYLTLEGQVSGGVAVTVNNSVPDAASVTHTTNTAGVGYIFNVFGRDRVSALSSLTFTSIDRNTLLTVATSTSSLSVNWTDVTETIATWEATDAVTMDERCVVSQHLQTSTHNYRSFGTEVPGLGWNYTRGVVVGVPFPIQTVVRNLAKTRAFSFTSGLLVKMTKSSWSGCNDGGNLSVLQLNPVVSGTQQFLGDIASWTDVGNALGNTRGVATPWGLFPRECEKCVIQMELCYSGKTEATCLEGLGAGSTDPSDAAPIFAERMKTTKPFTVNLPQMDLIEVHQQTLPPVSTTGTIAVGDVFQVQIETVSRHAGKWVFIETGTNTWTREVWVRSVWAPTGTDSLTSSEMRYGYGGFMHDGAARLTGSLGFGCGAMVSKTEFGAASMRARLSGAQSGTLSFFFVRPCQKCKIALDYRLSPPTGQTGKVRTSTFLLRDYMNSVTGNPLSYKIVTCSNGWIQSGVSHTAVHRRRPFSLTAIRVDFNNMPSWPTTDAATAALTYTAGTGNGGGGAPVVTSPFFTSSTLSTPAEEGSAMVRLHYPRACWKCSVSFALAQQDLAVLTTATRLVPLRQYGSLLEVQTVVAATDVAEWSFELYSADEVSDRSYTVGGPTEYAMHHRYRTKVLSQRQPEFLTAKATALANPKAVLADNAFTLASLSYGTPTLAITSGSMLYNGIPVPSAAGETGRLGTATVALAAGTLCVGCVVELSTPEGSTTWTYAKKSLSVKVSASPVPVRMAVENVAATSRTGACTTILKSKQCTFQAYAIGRAPGALPTSTSWYMAEMNAAASASVSCGTCGSAVVQATSFFNDGLASFNLQYGTVTTSPCVCTVTVRPPIALAELNATNQVFDVSYESPTASVVWSYVASPSLSVPASLTSTISVNTVANRSVVLRMQATGFASKLLWTGNSLTVTPSSMSPAGCFVCYGETTDMTSGLISCPVTVNLANNGNGDIAEIKGVFNTLGKCTIHAADFTGLPTEAAAASPKNGLAVTATTPAAAAVSSTFTRLHGRTWGGMPAAITGLGTVLNIRVLDSTGALLDGDNHMTATVTGTTPASGSWALTGTAKNGIISIPIVTDVTTRSAACNALTALTKADVCTHDPWSFTVQINAPVSVDGGVITSTSFQAASTVGPLYFVNRATRLAVFAQIGVPCVPTALVTCPTAPAGATAAETVLYDKRNSGLLPLAYFGTGVAGRDMHKGWHPATGHPAPWMFKKPFDMEVLALAPDASIVSHPEDRGSDAIVQFRSKTVPCYTADASAWLATTCANFTGATCSYANTISTLPACKSRSDWTISSQVFQLVGGKYSFTGVTYGSLLSQPGTAQFLLSSPGLGYPVHTGVDQGFPVDSTFIFETAMQESGSIRPTAGTGWQCNGSGKICQMVGFIEPEANFSISIDLLDLQGDLFVSDSLSTVSITGVCQGATGAFFASIIGPGTYEYIIPPKGTASNGVVVVPMVAATSVCPKMVLTATCSGGSGYCKNGASSIELTFRSRYVNANRTPVPAPPAEPITVSGLSVATFNTPDAAKKFIASVDTAAMEKSMLALLKKTNPVCTSPFLTEFLQIHLITFDCFS